MSKKNDISFQTKLSASRVLPRSRAKASKMEKTFDVSGEPNDIAVELKAKETNLRSQEINEELRVGGVTPNNLMNDETGDIESSSVTKEHQNDDAIELEGAERNPTRMRGDDCSPGQDPPRRPGAFAVGGINPSLSFTGSEVSRQEGTEEVAQHLDTSTIPQISAQLVDKAAEERRRQEFERERQRNRELESEIRQIRSDAVVAIPVTVEDTDGPKPSTNREDMASRTDCFHSTKFKRWCAGALAIVVVAAVVGLVLGVMLGNPHSEQPSSVVTTWNQKGQILEGEAAGNGFGFSLAMSRNGAVVAGGGPLNDNNGIDAGHVRVFSYDSGSKSWDKLGQDLNGNVALDMFGYSVALSSGGNVVAAGARTDPDRSGYIKVHKYSSSTNQWNQIGQDVEGRAPHDWFGDSVALSADGGIVAAGGSGRLVNEVDYTGNETGYVRVFAFDKTASSWTPMGQDLNGTGIGDAFGRSVALSANGSILAVGADWSDSNGKDAGRVQVFSYDRSADSWVQVGLDLIGEAARDRFGTSVALSEDGTILAVGAPWNSGTNGLYSGHVRVFSYDGVTSLWNQMGKDIDGESEDNNFGESVALSADGITVAAGANRNDGKGGAFSGHVRVFWYNSTADQWNQVGQDLDGEGENDEFGVSVALSSDGSIVAAGAYLNDGNGPNSGHIRVFEAETSIVYPPDTPTFPPTVSPSHEESIWNPLGQTMDGEAARNFFGFSVALSANGTVVAGGATRNNFNGQSAGQVRVFSYDSGFDRWQQLGQDLNGNEAGDEFGHSVALSNNGNIVAAGAVTDVDRNGYVKVHAFNSTANRWNQVGKDMEGRAPGDWFGDSVALSADGAIVAAGGPGRAVNEDDYSGNKTGYVQVLKFDNTTALWTPMGQVLNDAGIGDAFGRSVALSSDGTILAVGADRSDGSNGQDAGQVQVFKYDSITDRWNQMGQELFGEGASDYFGASVALSDDGAILAVGAVWNDGAGIGSGHVRIFSYDRSSNRWEQMGQDIDGEAESNNFGHSTTLSADGMVLASGANINDGDGGENSGHLRVFSYNNSTDSWNQVATDLDGEGEDDRFGVSVALSSDGTIVAAGAHRNDGNGPDSGHVRVYKTPESSN